MNCGRGLLLRTRGRFAGSDPLRRHSNSSHARLLNFIVAIYLIIIGLVGLFNLCSGSLNPEERSRRTEVRDYSSRQGEKKERRRRACGCQEQKETAEIPSAFISLAETQQTSDPEPKKTRLLSVSQSDLFSCWLLATNINVDTV
jgi:cytoskeletal protein RodZ